MVKGMNVFRDYFSGYMDQYVLIGGAACDISFHEIDMLKFIETFHVTDAELKNLKITGVHEADILKALEQTFGLLQNNY